MSDNAALVLRIKIQGLNFGSTEPHRSGTLLKNGEIYNPNQEDKEYQRWGHERGLVYSLVSKFMLVAKYLWKLQTIYIVDHSPIPNSDRFYLNQANISY